jgi:hypothetical protein
MQVRPATPELVWTDNSRITEITSGSEIYHYRTSMKDRLYQTHN